MDPHPQHASGSARPLSEQSAKVMEDVKELGHAALGQAEEALHEARLRGRELADSGRERMVDARQDLESYVRTHPMKSLLIAAGVGSLLSLLIRR